VEWRVLVLHVLAVVVEHPLAPTHDEPSPVANGSTLAQNEAL
jgi:hypothetical protein